MLRGFAAFAEGQPDWRLRLAGDGSERGELERLAAELGLEATPALHVEHEFLFL